jgi:tetratricopeptide (TPR) repeat protein
MNTKGLTEFFEENWRLLAGVVGALAVILAVAGFVNEQRKQKEREATNLLYEVQAKARALAAENRLQDAEAAFAPLLEKFPKSRAAYEGSLQLGDLWMDSGDFDKAVAQYERAAGIARDSFSRLLARYNLGIARETAGHFQEAVSSYEEALKTEGSDFLRPEILMAMARCLEALQQIPRAVEIYQEIQREFASRSFYSGAASAFEKQLTAGQGQ